MSSQHIKAGRGVMLVCHTHTHCLEKIKIKVVFVNNSVNENNQMAFKIVKSISKDLKVHLHSMHSIAHVKTTRRVLFRHLMSLQF